MDTTDDIILDQTNKKNMNIIKDDLDLFAENNKIQQYNNTVESDDAKRKEALNVCQSFIVQAPAGSGKTSLLVHRFLSLLLVVNKDPEECLALTFTRKAAKEMRDRILHALIEAQKEDPPPNAYEHETWFLAKKVLKRDSDLEWNLISNPQRLRIQTIDALCASLVKKMPILSGLGSLISIDENPKELYEKAADNCLKNLENNEPWAQSLKDLLKHLDNNLHLTQKLLAEMLIHREQWLPHIGKTLNMRSDQVQSQISSLDSLQVPIYSDDSGQDLSSLRSAFENSLKIVVQEILAEVTHCIPKDCEEIFSLIAFASENLSMNSNSSNIFQLPIIQQWPGFHLNDLNTWQALAQFLLTESGLFRKTVTISQGFPAVSVAQNPEEKQLFKTKKDEMLLLLEKCHLHLDFQEALQNCKNAPPLKYSDQQWLILKALLEILPHLVAELMWVFQQEGVSDFAEVAIAAQRALGVEGYPSDLALSLDYKINHILIDEFQDTSITQLKLIEKLTFGWQPHEGKTLFLVGDPQQSIYRFRQAEVSLFIRVKEQGINGLPLKFLVLTRNFRSDPKLIDWINQQFMQIFPKEDNFVNGAIAFQPSTPHHSADNLAEVLLQQVDESTESQCVLEILTSIKNNHPNTSTALLVRNRSHLKHLLPALKEAQIAYQGIDLEHLYQRTTIRDLIVLARALVHLGDRIAWLALLRGPWIRLSLNDIFYIANFEVNLPIWWALQRFSEIPNLSNEARLRLTNLIPILMQTFKNQGNTLLFSEWILDCWLSLGGADNLSKSELDDLDKFLHVLDKKKDLFYFYELGVLEEEFQGLYAQSTIETNANRVDNANHADNPHQLDLAKNILQVMTIHRAKGLEFDNVIVAGLRTKQKGESEKLLLWQERPTRYFKQQYGYNQENAYLVLVPIKSRREKEDKIYAYLKKQQQVQNYYESQRLLYVATTRAKKRLYCLMHQDVLFQNL